MNIFRWLTGILSLIFIFIFFILFTSAGFRTTLYVMQKLTPGKLEIKNIQGVLFSPFTINDLAYQNENIDLHLHSVKINWKLLTLFKGHLDINYINLNNLVIKIQPSNTSSHSSSFTSSLKKLSHLDIFHINANTLKLIYNGQDIVINSFQLNKVAKNYLFILEPLHGNIIGNFNINLYPSLKWQTELYVQALNLTDFFAAIPGLINANIISSGKWNNAKFEKTHFILKQLTGNFNNKPLQGNLDFILNENEIYFNQGILKLDNAVMTIKGLNNAKNTNIQWYLNIPQLQIFNPHFFGNLYLEGQLYKSDKFYLRSQLLGKNINLPNVQIKQINGNVTTRLSDELVQLNLILKELTIYHYKIPQIILLSHTKISYPVFETYVNCALNPFNKLIANMNLKIDSDSIKQTPISGKIEINLQKLSALVHSNKIKNLSGKLTAILNVSGLLASPHLTGDMNFIDGKITLIQLGITPKNIFLKGILNWPSFVNIDGKFRSGIGEGQIKSHINISQSNISVFIKLLGSNLQTLNLPEYQMRLTPDINLSYTTNQNINITGHLIVPFLNIKTNSVAQAVVLPPEVQVLNKQDKPFFTSSNLKINLSVQLGDQIHVAYQHLLAKLSGNLTISQLIGGFPTAMGTIQVDEGSYFLYNQLLTIEQGRLIYLGSEIRNPLLDLRAIKKLNSSSFSGLLSQEENTPQSNEVDTYVGASIQGTLLNPHITLISNPAMSQNDILSYLLFGKPLNQMSGNSFAILGTVSSSLNMLSPNASDGSSPSSPLTNGIMKLGAFNPVQAFNFNYPWTKHFSFKTESSVEEVGADLIYRYDQD